jgi:two-component system phosphate regulon response regulator PhoB
MVKPSVLIIGRNESLRHRLASSLQNAGCQVFTAADGRQGVQQAVDALPDIVMLGQDLPDSDSLEVCREIRRLLQPRRSPVFLVTPDGDADEASGERRGKMPSVNRGWNYVEYGFGALLAWIDASGGVHDRIACQGLELDRRRFLATLEGRNIGLTATEFRLLWLLASEPGKVFDRQQLAQLCGTGGRSRIRTVDVHIKAIRDKLGDRACLVTTVHGVGYRFTEHGAAPRAEVGRPAVPSAGAQTSQKR